MCRVAAQTRGPGLRLSQKVQQLKKSAAVITSNPLDTINKLFGNVIASLRVRRRHRSTTLLISSSVAYWCPDWLLCLLQIEPPNPGDSNLDHIQQSPHPHRTSTTALCWRRSPAPLRARDALGPHTRRSPGEPLRNWAGEQYTARDPVSD
ncbi:hypothetical protein NDU88_004351 [Pleurodeles waltl]|uniref:Uncharacterized protein n=1 Tax=Pleurodeles waltl TaxID=8319 RepID=A0AAV7NNA1_PLEWA|nr:hypothetical protein NDU88_004351 [Pleurodeles waltl]